MTDPSTIKFVLFDWGGVCSSDGEPFACEELQQETGKNVDQLIAEVKGLYLDFYRGKYTTHDYWTEVLSRLGIERTSILTDEALSKAYIASATIWNDMLDIARELKKKYTVALLSDLTPIMKQSIQERVDLADIFEQQVYSCDVGSIKMDGSKIFDYTLSLLNAKPSEVLFIDNSQGKIDVAESIGIATLKFQSKEQFEHDIAVFLKKEF